jgi:16S rRNA (guanine527-N7)-methyltransferase
MVRAAWMADFDASLHPVFDPARPLKRPFEPLSTATLERLRARLDEGLRALGLDETTDAAQRDILVRSLAFLAEWNAVINLTAIRDADEMLTQHVLDSLSVVAHLPPPRPAGEPRLRLLDVGSGGGFPALPLAVIRPDLDVVSLDAVRKKTDYVAKAARFLALPNLASVHSRVEQHQPTYDVVISRAYASLRDFVKSAGHCAGTSGLLLAMKGKQPDDEVKELAKTPFRVAEIVPLSVPSLEAARCLVRLRRQSK